MTVSFDPRSGIPPQGHPHPGQPNPDKSPTAVTSVSGQSVPDDPEAFLAAHPDIRSIELLLPDLNGVMRGKRIGRDGLLRVLEKGVMMPGSVFALDCTGANVDKTGLVWEDGDADRVCRPVPGTLAAVPWTPNTAQVFLRMEEEDGTPFPIDPQNVLARVIDRFAEIGLRPCVAMEFEFYLIDTQRTENGGPMPPRSPHSQRRLDGVQAYSMSEISDFDTFIERVSYACDVQALPRDTVISEYGPGQMEINLMHEPDAMDSAMNGVLLKRAVVGTALACGIDATFMAKPYAAEAGNGLHVHMSLLDAAGENVFSPDHGGHRIEGALMSPDDLHGAAIAGMADLMAESMALFAPNVNSFRRLRPGSYAPLTPSWSHNNRTAALRVPAGPPSARRVEHRVAGADANPFLVMAAVLAGAHHGIVNRMKPAPPISGNAYEKAATLPVRWQDALDAFDRAKHIRPYLGERFCRVYSAVRRAERQRFENVVSPTEHHWYLRNI